MVLIIYDGSWINNKKDDDTGSCCVFSMTDVLKLSRSGITIPEDQGW